jgi:hypothetical protein
VCKVEQTALSPLNYSAKLFCRRMKTGDVMTVLRVLIVLCCISAAAWADSIPLNGGGFLYNYNPIIFNLEGFAPAGTTQGFALAGVPAGNVYFGTMNDQGNRSYGWLEICNPQTGAILLLGRFKDAAINGSLFTATFSGFRGNPFRGFHVTLVEHINLATMTIQSGQLVATPVPEPGSLWLAITGMAGAGAARWRKK